MLNITNYNLNPFKNYNSQIKQQTKTAPLFLKKSNLSPLLKDTVSFTSRKESLDKIDNLDKCKEIHNEAKFAHKRIESIISKYFNKLIYDKELNKDGVINPIDTRIKTPESIREKTISRLQKALKNDIHTVFSPYDKAQIKNNIRDISGTQITLRNMDDGGDKIIDTICEMIEEQHLIVEEIENHITENQSINPYFDNDQLEKLRKVANKQREYHGLKPIEKVLDTKKDTGYVALHITYNMGNFPTKKACNSGYFHEMQIIGSDVNILKEVENFCYKLESNKEIKQGHVAYTPFESYFLEVYPDPKDDSLKAKKLKKAFKDYTAKAYEMQRKRNEKGNNAKDDVTNWAYQYPSLKDCGMEGKLPPILDFNILARIKRDCDDLYKVKVRTQEILDGKENEVDSKVKIKYKKQ